MSSEVDLMRLRKGKSGGREQENLSSWKVGAVAPRRDVPHPHSPKQWGALSGRAQVRRGSGAACLSFPTPAPQ